MNLHKGLNTFLTTVLKGSGGSIKDMDKLSIKRKTVDGWEVILSQAQLKEISTVLQAYDEAKEKTTGDVVVLEIKIDRNVTNE